jgi:hypothetical protein
MVSHLDATINFDTVNTSSIISIRATIIINLITIISETSSIIYHYSYYELNIVTQRL